MLVIGISKNLRGTLFLKAQDASFLVYVCSSQELTKEIITVNSQAL